MKVQVKLIYTFYTKVFNDNDAPWFRDEFIESGSINYHVNGQKKFWLDIMGAGPLYTGGELKLNFKHKLVENIMNFEGAQRWMYHMTLSLKELQFHLIKDKRIIKCILKFLYFFNIQLNLILISLNYIMKINYKFKYILIIFI